MFTRRYFVSGIALSSCALLLGPGLQLWERRGSPNAIASLLGLGRRSPSELTPRGFHPHVGENFQLSSGDGSSFNAKLSEIVERSDRIQGGRRLDQFSLIFEGPGVEGLEQGNFVLSHPAHGECELFMVPIGPPGKHRNYEASFTRLA